MKKIEKNLYCTDCIAFLQIVPAALFVGKRVAVKLALFGLGAECLAENQSQKMEPSATPM